MLAFEFWNHSGLLKHVLTPYPQLEENVSLLSSWNSQMHFGHEKLSGCSLLPTCKGNEYWNSSEIKTLNLGWGLFTWCYIFSSKAGEKLFSCFGGVIIYYPWSRCIRMANQNHIGNSNSVIAYLFQSPNLPRQYADEVTFWCFIYKPICFISICI